MAEPRDDSLRFPPFRLLAGVDLLYRGEEVVPLERRAVHVLRYLAENRHRVVTKEELLEQLWPGVFTTESVLTRAISLVRRALDDDANRPRFIRTFHGRGYQFVAPVGVDTSPPAVSADSVQRTARTRPMAVAPGAATGAVVEGAAPDGLTGAVFDGRYKVFGLVGCGGMGAVYRAVHLRLRRTVAIKVIRPDRTADRRAVERFEREAQLVASLRHPHIVTVHDFGRTAEGRFYLVMEYLDGRSLRDELERGPLAPGMAAALMRKVCLAVEAAHRAGIVHRDLKPENIFLEKAVGAAPHVKILDFGVAQLHETSAAPAGGDVAGTPAYMAPEQHAGVRVDARADIYALGVVLYEMLTGRPPFSGVTPSELFRRHAYHEPPPLVAKLPGLPAALDEAVMRALAKSPDDRFQSAAELCEALAAFEEAGPGPAAPAPWASDGTTVPDGEGERTVAVDAPSNLPQRVTSFVGRDAELDGVREALGRSRLVTLAGPGGIGKTRLALEAAGQLLAHFPDGVWLAELAPLASGALVPEAVAGALGVRGEQGRPLEDVLADWLAPRRLLLILDNCEHVVEACAALVERLLPASAGLRVLATSREVLDVDGEAVFPVPRLRVGGPDGGEAVRLFAERARAADPAFALTQESAVAAARLCEVLEGIPLAIELAATHVRTRPVEEILARARDRFELLARSRPGGGRLRSLRAAIDWSYELLSDDERSLLGRLSVFAGGWPADAIDAVWPRDGGRAILRRLADKSLVYAERCGRYGMLETIREYAREKLRASGVEPDALGRHAGWGLGLAELAAADLAWSGERNWGLLLEADLDNFRAALRWSVVDGNDPELGLRLCTVLKRFWLQRGFVTEGRAWLTAALAAAPATSPALHLRAVSAASALAEVQGDFGHARPLLEEALGGPLGAGDADSRARALLTLGTILERMGDYDAAEARLEEALALAERIGAPGLVGVALTGLGTVALDRCDFALSRALRERALAHFSERNDPANMAVSLYNLAEVAAYEGRYDDAEALAAEGLEIARAHRTPHVISAALCLLGAVATATGAPERARAFVAEAIEIARDTGDRERVAHALDGFARLAAAGGDAARAMRLAGAAAALRREIRFEMPPPYEADLGRALRPALGALAEARAADEMAVGAGLGEGEAIAYALEAADGTSPATE